MARSDALLLLSAVAVATMGCAPAFIVPQRSPLQSVPAAPRAPRVQVDPSLESRVVPAGPFAATKGRTLALLRPRFVGPEAVLAPAKAARSAEPGGGLDIAALIESAKGVATKLVPSLGAGRTWADELSDEILFGLLGRKAQVIDLTGLGTLKASSQKKLSGGEPTEVSGDLDDVALLGRVAGARYVMASRAYVSPAGDGGDLRIRLLPPGSADYAASLRTLADQCDDAAAKADQAKTTFTTAVEAAYGKYDEANKGFKRTMGDLMWGAASKHAKNASAQSAAAADSVASQARQRAAALRAFATVIDNHLGPNAVYVSEAALASSFSTEADKLEDTGSRQEFNSLRTRVFEELHRIAAGLKYVGLDVRLIDTDSAQTAFLGRYRILVPTLQQSTSDLSEAVVKVLAPTAAELRPPPRSKNSNRSRNSNRKK